jgi:DNA-binding response OmpR family regulator
MTTSKPPGPILPDPKQLGIDQPIILVADDDVMVRNLITLLLQSERYVVLSASDGQEGLELSRKYPGKIDLLITDVDMPRLNGMNLYSHLLQERPGIKTIVMSGGDAHEILRHNVNLPFLPKPFDGEALFSRVREILGASVESPKQAQKKP